MKTVTRLTSVILAVAFCASAFAGSDQPQVKVTRQKKTKACYVMSTASGIPVPCDRLRGIPTTDVNLMIIGNRSN